MSEQLLSSVNSDYNNDLHNWAEIERQVTNIAKAGFTHTQWIHDWEGEYLYSASEMFQVRDLLRGVGVRAHSIHASEGGRRTIRVNGRPVFRNRHPGLRISARTTPPSTSTPAWPVWSC